MESEFEFSVGNQVLAYDNGLLYTAKCLKRRKTETGDIQYFISYKGFKSKWNEWVNEDEVLEVNEINLGHKERLVTNLKNLRKSQKKKKKPNSPSPKKEGIRKRGRPRQTIHLTETNSIHKEIKVSTRKQIRSVKKIKYVESNSIISCSSPKEELRKSGRSRKILNLPKTITIHEDLQLDASDVISEHAIEYNSEPAVVQASGPSIEQTAKPTIDEMLKVEETILCHKEEVDTNLKNLKTSKKKKESFSIINSFSPREGLRKRGRPRQTIHLTETNSIHKEIKVSTRKQIRSVKKIKYVESNSIISCSSPKEELRKSGRSRKILNLPKTITIHEDLQLDASDVISEHAIEYNSEPAVVQASGPSIEQTAKPTIDEMLKVEEIILGHKEEVNTNLKNLKTSKKKKEPFSIINSFSPREGLRKRVNENDCKTRMYTIKDSDKKNMKKHKLSTSSTTPTKSKYNYNGLSLLNNTEDERRFKSNIACNDNLNCSEITENESFDQTAKIESKEKCLNNYGQIPLKTDIQETNNSFIDILRKLYKKQTDQETEIKMLKEMIKGMEEQLIALKKICYRDKNEDS